MVIAGIEMWISLCKSASDRRENRSGAREQGGTVQLGWGGGGGDRDHRSPAEVGLAHVLLGYLGDQRRVMAAAVFRLDDRRLYAAGVLQVLCACEKKRNSAVKRCVGRRMCIVSSLPSAPIATPHRHPRRHPPSTPIEQTRCTFICEGTPYSLPPTFTAVSPRKFDPVSLIDFKCHLPVINPELRRLLKPVLALFYAQLELRR
jgi:hypothetical protein